MTAIPTFKLGDTVKRVRNTKATPENMLSYPIGAVGEITHIYSSGSIALGTSKSGVTALDFELVVVEPTLEQAVIETRKAVATAANTVKHLQDQHRAMVKQRDEDFEAVAGPLSVLSSRITQARRAQNEATRDWENALAAFDKSL